ncbi:PREDICTED: uncharacterized protein LOC108373482 [Rhagoletis zephyria]|uniref:uncharacterized protein LOC108373482 n=1 Tax=Rhagoletis zephyria TaxID=28612 RepID=UPI0008112578|nr:PREDICTED: uncharacterized protein LOC108373482 [Rhagoletis zephyria]
MPEDNFEDAVTTVQVARLAVKAPPFWKPDPRLWFAQVEAQFVRSGISTDETKFYAIVAEVDSAILAHATDIISAQPATNKYNTLKERLIDEFGESTERRLKRLFETCELNDRKPTTLLREMKELANHRLDKQILKSLWMRRLPVHVQQILATLNDDVEILAQKADDILDISPGDKLSTIDTEDTRATLADLVSSLIALKVRINVMLIVSVMVGIKRLHPRDQLQSNICWYHQAFGEQANKCRPPCAYVRPRSEN